MITLILMSSDTEVKKIADTLYISDLDGTLLNSDAQVSAESAKLINAAIDKGIRFTFATARSVYSAAPITSAININVPCILMNGVSVYDLKTDTYIKNEYIPPSASCEIIKAFKESSLECFMYKIHGGVLTCYYTEITERVMQSFAEVRRNRYNKPFVKCRDLADEADGETVYFTIIDSRERLLPVKDAAERITELDFAFYQDTYTEKWYLEIFSANASKKNGIEFLCRQYGFDRVVSFGDNLNDLPMFARSDLKIAVANAKDEVKNAADFITLSNEQDGVAKWLADNIK